MSSSPLLLSSEGSGEDAHREGEETEAMNLVPITSASSKERLSGEHRESGLIWGRSTLGVPPLPPEG